MNSLRRIDILFFAFLLITTILILPAWNQSGNSFELIFVRGLIILTIMSVIYLNSRISNQTIYLLRMTYPVILSGYFYSETVYHNKLFIGNIDSILVRVESAIFDMQPTLEFSLIFSNKLFSELMYFGYFSFYLIILGFTLYFFFKKKEIFNESVFKLSASLYIFYLVFCLLPSAGPQYYFSYPENILPEGYLFEHIMKIIQNIAEQPTGAFPSSHVGISIIILIMSKKNAPQFFKFTWPFVVILILSTVYIKAHYVIDIIGGILIAPFILYLSNILYRLPALKKLG